MRARDLPALLLALGLAAVALALGVHLAGGARAARLEVARVKPTQLEPATLERLRTLDAEVAVTFFASAPERAPSSMHGLREEVAALLEAMARASDGRLHWELADPDADPELAAYASLCQVKPVRVRTVTRDAWSERSVWSTLSIAYGARPRTQIAGVTPANLGVLQGWIAAQLDQLERPRRPRVALDAPERGYVRLAERLARNADVVHTDLDAPGSGSPQADILVWVEPREPSAAAARALLALLEEGRSVVVAGSGWHALRQASPEWIAFEPTAASASAFLGGLGLEPLPGLVLDVLAEDRSGPAGDVALPWRVRCIAPNQDFRELQGQPNGTILFEAATAFVPDEARLDELGLEFTALATAGPEAWLQTPSEDPLRIADLAPLAGVALPKPTLAALLSPRDARRGSLVLLGSASPLRDEELAREDAAHGVLVDVLLADLTSPERLVAARMSAPAPQRLPPLEPGERALWRAVCVVLPPVLLALAFALSAGRGLRRRPTPRALRALGAACVALAALAGVQALARTTASGRLDLTRQRLHALAPETRAIAARLAHPLEAELVFSRDLPPELADLPARVEDLLRELGGAPGPGVRVRRTAPEGLSSGELAVLAARGAAPLALRVRAADETSVRNVLATLLLACGEREQVLSFPDAPSAEPLELRLALALGRLAGDPRARGRVVFVGDTPRLSPAEAHLEYQVKGRFAPTGADVHALARQTLERAGLEVVARPAASTEPLGEADLVVWLQPRRNIAPMLERLAAHLHAGGRALVAAQHFNVRSRQLAEQGFRTVHWPEPQLPDIDEGWVANLGARLVREVLCDPSHVSLELPTEVERPGEGRDFVLQESTQPFQIRALASRFARATPLVAGLSDQLFLWGNRFELDRERLARLGLQAQVLMETGAGAWAIDWGGGYLDPAALAGPPPSGPLGTQPLAVRLRGPFPPLDAEPGQPSPQAPPGELVLLGCSEMFENPQLRRPGFRADQLLLDIVATLALGEDYGRIAARRASTPGFEPPPPGQRLALRALVVGALPACLAILALFWRALRSRTRPGGGRP